MTLLEALAAAADHLVGEQRADVAPEEAGRDGLDVARIR